MLVIAMIILLALIVQVAAVGGGGLILARHLRLRLDISAASPSALLYLGPFDLCYMCELGSSRQGGQPRSSHSLRPTNAKKYDGVAL